MSVALLPHVNALINTGVAILLVVGLVLIKRGEREAHKKVMTAALALSALFLASYLVYHYQHGSTKFTGTGPIRTVYFTLLLTHTVLAVVNLPFIVLTVLRAWRGQFAKHRRIAKATWYMWFYVAVTGPLVYLLLYQLYPASRLDDLFAEARAMHEAGNVDAALLKYEELAPYHPGARCFAAVVGDRIEGKSTRAKTLEETLKAHPDDVACLTLQGREHVYADRLEAAVPLLTRAQELAPKDPFTHASLGFAHYRAYEYEEAAAAFEKAYALKPERTLHLANAAYAHYHYGNYPKARPLLEKALSRGGVGEEFEERLEEARDVIDGAKWRCPMHKHVTGKKGDICSECRMKLAPAEVELHVETTE